MTENDQRLVAKLAALAVDGPVMVVGCGDGLGSDEMLLAAMAREKGVHIIVLQDAPPQQKDFVLTLAEAESIKSLMMPVVYKPEREWWRGGNPKRRRSA